MAEDAFRLNKCEAKHHIPSALQPKQPNPNPNQIMSLTRITTARQALRSTATSHRAFSLSTRTMAEGSTGGARSGGAAQGDAFTKREKANEDYYVREQEKQKLEALKKKIADGEAQLAQDRKDAEALGKK